MKKQQELITYLTAFTKLGAWNKVRELFASEYELDKELTERYGPNIYRMTNGNKHGLIIDCSDSLEVHYIEDCADGSYCRICTIWIATEQAVEEKIKELERVNKLLDERNWELKKQLEETKRKMN